MPTNLEILEAPGAINRIKEKVREQRTTFAGSEALTFNVYQMPPTSRIYAYVDGVQVTHFCAPFNIGAKMGDPIVTNQQGSASGYLYIPSADGKYKFLTGEIRITFGDSPNGIQNCRCLAECILYNHGDKLVDINQGSTVSLRTTEKVRTVNRNDNEDYLVQGVSVAESNKLELLAQTFLVPETKYPSGIFLTGVSLFLYDIDPALPIGVELRPVVGETPSSTEYFSGSYVEKYPQTISIYSPALNRAPATDFTFEHPIYLKAGNYYAFCVVTKSDKYKLLSAKTGDGKVQKQPFTGQLFRSQSQVGEWKGDANEDLTFVLRKARFETGSKTFTISNPKIAPIEYNRFRLLTSEISLGDTATTEYTLRTKNSNGAFTPYKNLLSTGIADLPGRQLVEEEGDISLQATLTTKSKDISPVLDKQLLKSQILKNLITPYSEEISNSELKSTHGSAKSRYIGNVVTLAQDFDSTGIEISMDVNRKTGTDIEVFCRVLSREDKNYSRGIEERPWQRVPLSQPIRKTFAGSSDVAYFREIYRLLEPDLYYGYTSDKVGASGDVETEYKTFSSYQIKIVFYASSEKYLPKIKNLAATALL